MLLAFRVHSVTFPDSSVGGEFACNAGDPGWTPGSERSPGEGIDYPLQYSWASLVAQLVKNQPAMRETWVQSLGWEDPLEKGTTTHSSNSGLENSMDCIAHEVAKSQTRLSDFHFHMKRDERRKKKDVNDKKEIKTGIYAIVSYTNELYSSSLT